jgi:hypothetical protein
VTRSRCALLVLCVCACSETADRGAELAVFTEGARPRWEDPLPTRTAIFDGTRVRLRGVRGETIGVHVVRRPMGTAEISLELNDERVDVTAFSVDYGNVTQPSTAMYGGSRGRGRYPDRLTPTEQPVILGRSVFFDIAIAPDAAPGVHAGVLEVDENNIPVELTVENTDPIDIVSKPRAWAYYDAKEIARAGNTPESTYAALLRAHGIVASPELTLASYDERRASVAGLSFIPVLLPPTCDAIRGEVAQWITRTAGTGQVPFAIPIDEPRHLVDQLRVRARAACVRAGGGGPDRFLYAVTHEPTWLMGTDVDVHISPFGGDWTYNGTPPFAGAMVLDAADPGLRTWGWIAFRHDLPLWYVWDAIYFRDRYNKGRDQAPAHDLVADPLTFDDGEDHGNLDGVLAYPGALPSLRLKALRRGFEDRALLEQLAGCAGRTAADAIAAPLVPRSLGTAKRGERASWPTSDDAFETARLTLLSAIAACRAHAGAAPSKDSPSSP